MPDQASLSLPLGARPTAPVRASRHSTAPRTPVGLGRLGSLLAVASLLVLGACSSPEFDAVREYKNFLEKAKPSLAAMNKAREDLYQLQDPEQMPALFRDKLLPQVEQLRQLAAAQPRLEGKLGDIHLNLSGTLNRYSDATRRLADRLKSESEAEREQAIVMWGEDDQKFGREMATLVDDLSHHLDQLKK